MAATITDKQCRINQGNKQWHCKGCTGLQDEQIIVEVEVMACYRVYCGTCDRQDVSLTSSGAVECWSCYKKRKAGEKQALESTGMAHELPTEVVLVPDPEFTEREEECIRRVDAAIEAGWEATEADPSPLYPLPNAEIVRTILNKSSHAVHVPADLATAWRERGLQSHHVLGLMELLLLGELAVIESTL